jgi:hypothetical protein
MSWSGRTTRSGAEQELEAATVVYYETLTPPEESEERSLSQALSRPTRTVRIDDPVTHAARRRRDS